MSVIMWNTEDGYRRLLTVRELADLVGVSPPLVSDAIKSGKVRGYHVKVGGVGVLMSWADEIRAYVRYPEKTSVYRHVLEVIHWPPRTK